MPDSSSTAQNMPALSSSSQQAEKTGGTETNATHLLAIRRRDLAFLAVAVVSVIVYILTSALSSAGIGFPLDDAWIHEVYARNLAQYGEWAFVHGIPSAASTSPLYTVILAIGYLLHLPFFVWAYAIGVLALTLTAMIGARLAERLFPDVRGVGWIVGLLLLAEWHLIWAAAAGMDTIVFIALELILIILTWREWNAPSGAASAFGRGLAVGLCGALLTDTRPEGVALVGLCGLFMLLARPQKTWRDYLAWAAGLSAAWFVGVLPVLLLNYSLNGSLMPDTSAAKHAENVAALATPFLDRFVQELVTLVAGVQLLLLPGLVYALYRWLRPTTRPIPAGKSLLIWILPTWFVLLIAAYSAWLPTPVQHGRYILPVLPPFLILGGGGLWALAVRYNRSRRLIIRVSIRVLAWTAAIVLLAFWGIGASAYTTDVGYINHQMVASAHWVAANVPDDKLFATHDIGAIGYFAPRPLFDLGGLISPEVVPIIINFPALMDTLQARNIHYMMVTESQLPTVPSDPRLCPLLVGPPAPPEIHMTVYWLAWDGHCPPPS